ncbi:hypothetical protein NMY22_g896 [Coprinellus aureogranulatus]|nr:hypothetical protein NMY22_g896 [Coprinellus aureogranulatus]
MADANPAIPKGKKAQKKQKNLTADNKEEGVSKPKKVKKPATPTAVQLTQALHDRPPYIDLKNPGTEGLYVEQIDIDKSLDQEQSPVASSLTRCPPRNCGTGCSLLSYASFSPFVTQNRQLVYFVVQPKTLSNMHDMESSVMAHSTATEEGGKMASNTSNHPLAPSPVTGSTSRVKSTRVCTPFVLAMNKFPSSTPRHLYSKLSRQCFEARKAA